MYTFLIVLILIASVLMVLAVLVQNPKSGMASNFGASNQVMGVRQTADFLEKFTWGTAVIVLLLSLLSIVFIPEGKIASSKSKGAKEMIDAGATTGSVAMPTEGAVTEEGTATEAPATEAPALAAPATEGAAPAAPATPATEGVAPATPAAPAAPAAAPAK